MKRDIHAKNYRLVVFEDLNNGHRLLTRSTASTSETTAWEDGNEYPLLKVHVSSSSHPFFTGEEKVLDIEGRVDKFKARAQAAEKAKQQRVKSAKKEALRKSSKEDKKTLAKS